MPRGTSSAKPRLRRPANWTEPLPLPPAKEPFGRKHVTDAQEAAEELLHRVMLRSKGQG